MNTLKDKKKDVEALALLLMKLSPEERERIKQGVIIGRTIFKPNNNGNSQKTG